MKKISTLIMVLFLFMGTFQLQAQSPKEAAPCTSITVVRQVCERDGTVTITFQVDNNSSTTVTLVNVIDSNGNVVGTSTTPIGPYSTGSFNYTYSGATPNTVECFNLYLYNERGFCCHREVCIRVQNCCDLQASVFTNDATCTSLGSAGVSVWGGTPAYNGGWTNTTTGTTGTFPTLSGSVSIWVPNLEPGVYTYWWVDRRGCRFRGTFTIRLRINGVNCNAFTFGANQGNLNNLNTQMTSAVSATITVQLQAFTVPDQANVTVNGVSPPGFPFSAGSSNCDGPSPGTVTQSFQVQPCDVVVFSVAGNICPLGGTAWNLNVSCGVNSLSSVGNGDVGKGDTSPAILGQQTEAEGYAIEMAFLTTAERANLNSEGDASSFAQSLKIFPNPVSDVLNIVNNNTKINYASVRVLDSSGKTMINENMSGRTNLQLDASALPLGIYIVEVMDDTGNRTVEKFIKVN